MRITSSTVVAAGVLAIALTVAGVLPAEAGKACNRLGFGSPCIKSNDLKARLNLDEGGRDARLRLRDARGDNAVELNARSFNVTNLFSTAENESNGLVKAWAEIDEDGRVAACWRCDPNPNATGLEATGLYVVDFTPLSTDIIGRPMSALLEGELGSIAAANSAIDRSVVLVRTGNTAGEPTNRRFFVIIY